MYGLPPAILAYYTVPSGSHILRVPIPKVTIEDIHSNQSRSICVPFIDVIVAQVSYQS